MYLGKLKMRVEAMMLVVCLGVKKCSYVNPSVGIRGLIVME